jgi:hypothetical protein
MIFVRKKIFFFLIIMATLTSCIKVYADTTKAYIKNDSEKPWKVKFIMIYGSLDAFSECSQNQECLINPQSFKIIIYNTDSNGLKGMAVITDYKGQRKAFNIDEDSVIHPHLPWLTALEESICPNDVDVNTTYGEDGRTWLGQDAGGGITFKYPYLCWPGNL